MVIGKCSGDEIRRQRRFGLRHFGEPEGKEGREKVPEDGVLTLSASR